MPPRGTNRRQRILTKTLTLDVCCAPQTRHRMLWAGGNERVTKVSAARHATRRAHRPAGQLGARSRTPSSRTLSMKHSQVASCPQKRQSNTTSASKRGGIVSACASACAADADGQRGDGPRPQPGARDSRARSVDFAGGGVPSFADLGFGGGLAAFFRLPIATSPHGRAASPGWRPRAVRRGRQRRQQV
jgi:hypothetical protein